MQKLELRRQKSEENYQQKDQIKKVINDSKTSSYVSAENTFMQSTNNQKKRSNNFDYDEDITSNFGKKEYSQSQISAKTILKKDDVKLVDIEQFHDLLEEQGLQKTKYTNFWRALYVSLGFFLLFTGFNGTQNILTQVMKDNKFDNFGNIIIGVLYGCFGLGGIASYGLLQKMGIRSCLALGSLCYLFTVSAQIIPSERARYINENRSGNQLYDNPSLIKIILIISAALNGFGAAILWTAQGEYFTGCSTQNTKGFYFGMFQSIWQVSHVVGSAVGAVIFTKNKNTTTFFITMSVLIFLATMSFIFIKKPIYDFDDKKGKINLGRTSLYYSKMSASQSRNQSLQNTLTQRLSTNREGSMGHPSANIIRQDNIGVDIFNDQLIQNIKKSTTNNAEKFAEQKKKKSTIDQRSILLQAHNDQVDTDPFETKQTLEEQNKISFSVQQKLNQQSFLLNLKETLNCLCQKKMLQFLPQIVWKGMSGAFYTGVLTPIMIYLQNNNKNYEDIESQQLANCLEAFIGFGFGQIISGIFMGKLIDFFGSKKTTFVNVFLVILVFATTVNAIQRNQFDWSSYLMCFVWGLQDGCVNTHTLQLLGFEFSNNSASFGVFSFVQSITICIIQIILSQTLSQDLQSQQNQYYVITSIVSVLGVFFLLSIYFLEFSENKIKKIEEKGGESMLESQTQAYMKANYQQPNNNQIEKEEKNKEQNWLQYQKSQNNYNRDMNFIQSQYAASQLANSFDKGPRDFGSAIDVKNTNQLIFNLRSSEKPFTNQLSFVNDEINIVHSQTNYYKASQNNLKPQNYPALSIKSKIPWDDEDESSSKNLKNTIPDISSKASDIQVTYI